MAPYVATGTTAAARTSTRTRGATGRRATRRARQRATPNRPPKPRGEDEHRITLGLITQRTGHDHAA